MTLRPTSHLPRSAHGLGFKESKKGSRLVIIHFDTRRGTVSALSNCNRLCSEEGPQRGMVALPPSLDPVLKA